MYIWLALVEIAIQRSGPEAPRESDPGDTSVARFPPRSAKMTEPEQSYALPSKLR